MTGQKCKNELKMARPADRTVEKSSEFDAIEVIMTGYIVRPYPLERYSLMSLTVDLHGEKGGDHRTECLLEGCTRCMSKCLWDITCLQKLSCMICIHANRLNAHTWHVIYV